MYTAIPLSVFLAWNKLQQKKCYVGFGNNAFNVHLAQLSDAVKISFDGGAAQDRGNKLDSRPAATGLICSVPMNFSAVDLC